MWVTSGLLLIVRGFLLAVAVFVRGWALIGCAWALVWLCLCVGPYLLGSVLLFGCVTTTVICCVVDLLLRGSLLV